VSEIRKLKSLRKCYVEGSIQVLYALLLQKFCRINCQYNTKPQDRLMRIEVDLLGIVNDASAITSLSALQRKYVVKVTAEQLYLWLQYDRKAKGTNSAFKILDHSTIAIDEQIQRGRDSQGYLLQNPKKIMEIANTLLTPRKETVPRLYLGSLTWNVRPTLKKGETIEFDITKIEQPGKPPTWRLTFDTDKIYLTDSAHRHLAIVEAYKQYTKDPNKYPAFSTKLEFSVEIYTLDKQKEKELFSELNSKQKKISTAKQKEMDVSSPVGTLKDAIQDYDRQNMRFFDKNIEVSSNQNDKHTLVTMSVLVASIGEMFTTQQIKDSRDDTDLQEALSEYYCEFFYELSRTLVVKADIGEGLRDYHPYRNLYTEFISAAEDNFDANAPQSSEEKLQTARDKATNENQRLRKIDVANHNSFVKAFSRLGGRIRLMENWRDVIVRLQNQHNFPCNGQFFQKYNPELFEVNQKFGIPIASLNEDGTINIQVQSKTINAIYDYLITKLNLSRDAYLVIRDSEDEWRPIDGYTQQIMANESFSVVTCYFFVPSSVREISDGIVRLDVDFGQDFSAANKKGKNGGLVAANCEVDADYIDPDYKDIKRWKAMFEIPWPSNSKMNQSILQGTVKAFFPKFDDAESAEGKVFLLKLVKN
jgi:hypothetical protein